MTMEPRRSPRQRLTLPVLYHRVLTICLTSACVPDRGDGDGLPTPGRADSAAAWSSSPENVIPRQGCPNANPEQALERPTLCEWANSIDMVLVGSVLERSVVSSSYVVETHAVEGMQEAIDSLAVAEEFPWLGSVLSEEHADSLFQVVASCPDGLLKENDQWRIFADVVPSLAVSLKPELVWLGEVNEDAVLTFHVSWEQRQYWSGPKLRAGAWQGTQLAPGTHVGVALTYDAAMNLVLATHPPFGLDADGRVRAPATECTPRLTQELDGLSVEELRAKLALCSTDEGAVQMGEVLRQERIRLVSAPWHSPATAAFCAVGYDSKSSP